MPYQAEEREILKEDLLHAFNDAHIRLLSNADSAARNLTLEKSWGPREILAHIAAWEAEALSRIPLLIAGAPSKEYNADTFNAEALAAIGDQSFEQVKNMLQQTHQRLIAMLMTQEESVFTPDGSAYEWITAQTRHSNEHTRELDTLL